MAMDSAELRTRDGVAPTSDGWRFTHRRVIVEGHVPQSPVPSTLALT
jgi:hypothetical protein